MTDVITDTQTEGSLVVSGPIWESLCDYFTKSGESLIDLQIERVSTRRHSEISIVRGRSDRASRRYVVKRIRPSPLDSGTLPLNQAAVEYDTLSTFYPRFENIDNCSVLKPVACISEHNTLITEYVEGTALSDELKYLHYFSSLARFRQLKEYFRLCGMWLEHLQEIAGVAVSNDLDYEYFLTHCDERLAWLEANSTSHIPVGFRKAVMDYLEDLASSSKGVDIPMTGRHSDFGPWNILCHDGQITVLDFVGYRTDPLPMNILSVLVYMDSQKRGLANSRRRIDKLTRSFLDGFGPLPSMPQPVILICEAFHRIISLGSAATPMQTHCIKQLERTRCIKKQVKWFLQRPAKSNLWHV